jgi:hypothetical protein
MDAPELAEVDPPRHALAQGYDPSAVAQAPVAQAPPPAKHEARQPPPRKRQRTYVQREQRTAPPWDFGIFGGNRQHYGSRQEYRNWW